MSNDPMTDEQRDQLETLSRKTGEEISGHMTRAEADAKIQELSSESGLEDADLSERQPPRTD